MVQICITDWGVNISNNWITAAEQWHTSITGFFNGKFHAWLTPKKDALMNLSACGTVLCHLITVLRSDPGSTLYCQTVVLQCLLHTECWWFCRIFAGITFADIHDCSNKHFQVIRPSLIMNSPRCYCSPDFCPMIDAKDNNGQKPPASSYFISHMALSR